MVLVEKCVYANCMLKCRSKSHHRAIYARKKECEKADMPDRKSSTKINYEKLREIFPEDFQSK